MSTEPLRSVSVSPSVPGVSPAPSAALGAAVAGESPTDGAGGPGNGPVYRQGGSSRTTRPGGTEASRAAATKGRRPCGAPPRPGEPPRGPAADGGANAARTGATGQGAPGKGAQPGESAPPGADFSHTLALSLSTPEQPAAGRASPTAGKSAKVPAREAGHGEKTDPVAVAMALMDRAGAAPAPVAARASAPNPAGKPAPGAVVVAQAGQSTGAVTAATTAAVHTALAESMPGPAAAAGHPAAASVGQPGGAGPLTAAQLVASTQASASNPSTSAGGPALAAPVGSGAWTEQLAARLTWMTQQGVQSASLQLSPRNLGPLQVSITVQRGQASVWFGATQPETRQALARALPELRNLFANQGLSLTDSGVSHDAPRQGRAGPGGVAMAGGEASGLQGEASAAPAPLGVGLIDTYA